MKTGDISLIIKETESKEGKEWDCLFANNIYYSKY